MIKLTSRIPLILLAIGLLSSCSTMLPHYRMSADEVKGMGFGTAAGQFCLEQGYEIPVAQLTAHTAAADTVFAYAVFDRKQLDQAYVQSFTAFTTIPASGVVEFCGETQANYPRFVSWLQGLASSSVAARAMPLPALVVAPTAPPIAWDIPMPTGEVTYPQRQPAATGVTILGPDGVTVCAVNGNMAVCP